jgi:hypothetical protein
VKIFSTAQPDQKSVEVFPGLAKRLIENGFKTQEDASDAVYLVSFNHDEDNYKSFRRSGGVPENAILIRLEPAAVFPSQYLPRVEKLYGKIISPGSLTGDEFPRIPWPYYYHKNPLNPVIHNVDLKSLVSELIEMGIFDYDSWQIRPIYLSLIASNKVSPTATNNYKLRRQLARTLPSRIFSIYGGLWRASLIERLSHRVRVLYFAIKSRFLPSLFEIYGDLFRTYTSAMGSVEDKHEIIRQSKFSLVIENDNHYVSEKLLDALLGGSIPIYFGGKFDDIGIPNDAVVSGLSNTEDIVNFLERVTESEIQHYLESAQSWLNSPAFYHQWFGDTVFATITDEVADYFGKVVK